VSEFSIHAWSEHLHAVEEGETLPSLDARLQAVSRERFRRIDRFILLAMLGSAECAAKASLREDCGLYLSTGVGPVGSNTEVQRQLCREHLLPKPFNFVNTLGSAAGHYTAKNLGLGGQNLFISRRGAAFSAALAVATTDLDLGIVSQALVGAVEECSFPLEEHRQRQALGSDVKMAEGTHWILIERGGRADLPTLRLAPRTEPLYDAPLPFHDSREAALLTRWLERRDAKRFVAESFSAE
jgi:3-oxoacyl-(acyl-carrier-protein) synthase